MFVEVFRHEQFPFYTIPNIEVENKLLLFKRFFRKVSLECDCFIFQNWSFLLYHYEYGVWQPVSGGVVHKKQSHLLVCHSHYFRTIT